MKNTADFLDDLRAKLDVPSDYALGIKLGIRRQTISEYRKLKSSFDEHTCLRFADILETDPAYMVACMHYQREKSAEVKKIWERIATLTAGATLGLLAFLALPLFSFNEPAHAVRVAFDNNAYYASSIYIMRLAAVVFVFGIIALLLTLTNKKNAETECR